MAFGVAVLDLVGYAIFIILIRGFGEGLPLR